MRIICFFIALAIVLYRVGIGVMKDTKSNYLEITLPTFKRKSKK